MKKFESLNAAFTATTNLTMETALQRIAEYTSLNAAFTATTNLTDAQRAYGKGNVSLNAAFTATTNLTFFIESNNGHGETSQCRFHSNNQSDPVAVNFERNIPALSQCRFHSNNQSDRYNLGEVIRTDLCLNAAFTATTNLTRALLHTT